MEVVAEGARVVGDAGAVGDKVADPDGGGVRQPCKPRPFAKPLAGGIVEGEGAVFDQQHGERRDKGLAGAAAWHGSVAVQGGAGFLVGKAGGGADNAAVGQAHRSAQPGHLHLDSAFFEQGSEAPLIQGPSLCGPAHQGATDRGAD